MQTIGLSTIAIATVAFSGLAMAANEATATKAAGAATTTAQSQPTPPGTTSPRDVGSRPQTRDWSRVDANRDHLVSPEEMEAYLKANPGPLRDGRP